MKTYEEVEAAFLSLAEDLRTRKLAKELIQRHGVSSVRHSIDSEITDKRAALRAMVAEMQALGRGMPEFAHRAAHCEHVDVVTINGVDLYGKRGDGERLADSSRAKPGVPTPAPVCVKSPAFDPANPGEPVGYVQYARGPRAVTTHTVETRCGSCGSVSLTGPCPGPR